MSLIREDRCVACGWEGPCDLHRIVPGKKNGKYTSGNTLELCPNCHRLAHKGILDTATLVKHPVQAKPVLLIKDAESLLTREEAADFLRIKTQTLAMWASTRRYDLPYYTVGTKSVRYKQSDLNRFVENQVVGEAISDSA